MPRPAALAALAAILAAAVLATPAGAVTLRAYYGEVGRGALDRRDNAHDCRWVLDPTGRPGTCYWYVETTIDAGRWPLAALYAGAHGRRQARLAPPAGPHPSDGGGITPPAPTPDADVPLPPAGLLALALVVAGAATAAWRRT